MDQHKFLAIAGILLVFAALFALSACGPGPTPTPTPSPTPTPALLMELGVNSFNDPVQPNGDAGEATAVGASRDLWAVQWYWVEQPWRDDPPWGEGEFNWQGEFTHPWDPDNPAVTPPTTSFDIDGAAAAGAGLNTMVTLHGIPRLSDCTYWPQDQYPEHPEVGSRCSGAAERIEGLFEPALQGGVANPDNKWAYFVSETVSHLAQEPYHIHGYQIWNEPDEQWLHGGPLQDPQEEFLDDYVQMVKVTGEAAEQSGGDTLVLGAPSSNEALYAPPGDPVYEEADPNGPRGWIYQAWRRVQIDPTAKTHLDGIAIHAYDWPFQTWSIAERARGLISDWGLRPVLKGSTDGGII